MNHRHVSAVVALACATALLGAASTTASAGTAGTATRATPWQPCRLPSGYQHFVEFHSAKNVHGTTVVRVTPETCKVNKDNDEDVIYTPSGAPRSLTFAPGALVKVVRDTASVKVTPKWLVTHRLANSPYFYAHVDAQHRITALAEIYHP
ncbi:hypothetical protein ACIQOU_15675 [Streptomyces sp. NPDC091279]|uniref:hypothetical protein n=1 Tax=Streptomyces sp. NPDC091279 TaxID=3365983 RepID=UPI00382F3DC5